MNLTEERIEPSIVITLIHGTFARESSWSKPGHPLHDRLQEAFSSLVELPDQSQGMGL